MIWETLVGEEAESTKKGNLDGVIGEMGCEEAQLLTSEVLRRQDKNQQQAQGEANEKTINGLPKSDKSIAGVSKSEKSITGPVSPKESIIGPINSEKSIAGLSKSEKSITGPVSPKESIIGPANSENISVGPVNPEKSKAGPVNSVKTITGPVHPENITAGPINPENSSSGVVNADKSIVDRENSERKKLLLGQSKPREEKSLLGPFILERKDPQIKWRRLVREDNAHLEEAGHRDQSKIGKRGEMEGETGDVVVDMQGKRRKMEGGFPTSFLELAVEQPRHFQ